MKKIHPSEITPESIYLSRREFIKGLGVITAGSIILAACKGNESTLILTGENTPQAGASSDELGNQLTPYDVITNYNNYYEFSTDKKAVAKLSSEFITNPWELIVGGLVNHPKTYDIDELMRKYTQQERIYRLRCVETWSMVIPWIGFPLAELLREVQPNPNAKFVRFETLYDPQQMSGQKSDWYDWPYVEGLRIDEAMHELTILATGLYGKPLPPQSGAPIRLVVPWKYGFKSIKSVVRIDLVDTMPVSLWMAAAPNEYGFYANVNPQVNHPRWSQANELQIGDSSQRPTLMFNGYEEEVAHLYAGMDLLENF